MKNKWKGAKNEQNDSCKPWGRIYIYIYISRLLEKENKEMNRINIDNKITVKPKNIKI